MFTITTNFINLIDTKNKKNIPVNQALPTKNHCQDRLVHTTHFIVHI